MKHGTVTVTAEPNGFAIWHTVGDTAQLIQHSIPVLGNAVEQAQKLANNCRDALGKDDDGLYCRVVRC